MKDQQYCTATLILPILVATALAAQIDPVDHDSGCDYVAFMPPVATPPAIVFGSEQ